MLGDLQAVWILWKRRKSLAGKKDTHEKDQRGAATPFRSRNERAPDRRGLRRWKRYGSSVPETGAGSAASVAIAGRHRLCGAGEDIVPATAAALGGKKTDAGFRSDPQGTEESERHITAALVGIQREFTNRI